MNLYSDLLVHNMGAGLADDIVQGDAGPAEFRTAPLWGVGQRIFFLHDGRTSSLLDAIRGAIDEAIRARDEGQARVILFNLSGHGNFDLQAYDDYANGRLVDVEYSVTEVEAALAGLRQP